MVQLEQMHRSTQIKLLALNQFSFVGKMGVSCTSVATGFLSIQMMWLVSVPVQMENKLYLNTMLSGKVRPEACLED